MTPGTSTLLHCERLVIGHRGRPLVPAFQLAIARGTFVAIIGRNGAGKTTLLRTLVGLMPPISGQVVRATPALRLSYVAQASTLDRMMPLRARDVVAWGGITRWNFLRWPDPKRTRAACDRALDEAGASALADRLFRTLSEGQKQRVLMARMLAAEPDVAFLDEPTSALDVVAEEETVSHLARLGRDRGIAVVVITHVIPIAARFADQVVLIDRDDGVVVSGPPATVLAHPTFQRQFGAQGDARGA
jgi:zinc transport system ATP-binding protein